MIKAWTVINGTVVGRSFTTTREADAWIAVVERHNGRSFAWNVMR